MASGQMQRDLEAGQRVAWRFGAGEAKGRIVEKLTQDKKLNSKTYKASQDEPRYQIRSDKTGKEFIRKPQVLRILDENERDEENQNDGARDNATNADDMPYAAEADGGYQSEEEESEGKDNSTERDIIKAMQGTDGTEEDLIREMQGTNSEQDIMKAMNETFGSDDREKNMLPHQELPQPGKFTDLAHLGSLV